MGKQKTTERIVALAGRRVDASGADSRFPVASIPDVRRKLEARINRTVKGLVSSAACGADLLGLDTAERVGIPYYVVLPFPPEVFRRTSVIDRPGEDWGTLFDHIISRAGRKNCLVVDDLDPESELSFRATNHRIIDLARTMETEIESPASASSLERVAIVVWEGHSRGPNDITSHFLSLAKKAGFEIDTVLTSGRKIKNSETL